MKPFVLISTLLTTLLQLAEINLRWSQRLLKKYHLQCARTDLSDIPQDWLVSLKEMAELANEEEECQGTPPPQK